MPKYYLLDENKNLVEGYDKEGFLALLEEAIENGDLEHIDENSAVVSKLKSVLNGTTHNIEFVTQAQYNQLKEDEELVPNTYYFITDDTTLEGLEENLNDALSRLSSVENDVADIKNGTQVVGNATNAENTDFTNGEEYTFAIPNLPANIETLGEIAISDANIVNALKSNHCLIWLECTLLVPLSLIGITNPLINVNDMPDLTPIFNLAFSTGVLQYEYKQGYLEIKRHIGSSPESIHIKFKNFTGILMNGYTLHIKPIR